MLLASTSCLCLRMTLLLRSYCPWSCNPDQSPTHSLTFSYSFWGLAAIKCFWGGEAIMPLVMNLFSWKSLNQTRRHIKMQIPGGRRKVKHGNLICINSFLHLLLSGFKKNGELSRIRAQGLSIKRFSFFCRSHGLLWSSGRAIKVGLLLLLPTT